MSAHSRGHGHHHKHGHRHRNGMDGQARDREHEMITNRIILVVLVWSVCVFLGASSDLIIGFSIYFAVSVAIAAAYLLNRRPSGLRRFIGMVTDFGGAALLLQIGGESLAAAYPIFLWIILGNGFRFGVPWLFLASVMATISFGWTIYTVEYWRNSPSLSIGLLVGLLVIPAYCSTLITKISRAKEEAEEANKAKSLFLASISHELRTPLNAIIGYGTHLMDMKLPEKQHQMVTTSVSAGRHLLHLINQLLSFAHSDSLDELPEPKSFSLVDLLSEVSAIMKVAAEEKDLRIVLQAEASSDQLLLGQIDNVRNILINLTSNAIKFTETGTVTLQCGINTMADQQMLWLSVTDTGPGIPQEAQQKIFDVFQQADESVATEFGGTGLGLAICQKLASQMDGHISVNSVIGEGSTFTLTCPTEFAEEGNESSDIETVRILSLTQDEDGPVISDADPQSIQIDHIQCHPLDDLQKILDQRQLEDYDIALLDEAIAADHDDQSPFWTIFRDAKLPPVLLTEGKRKTLQDIQLRAAFATVLPSGSNYTDVRSAVQIGCSFVGARPQEPIGEIPATEAINHDPARVLIADDNRTNQMVIETILANAGHEVVVVVDGEEALQALEESEFDIVFLDVNMPVMGGIECCRLWRQIEGPRSHIPIIGLTADSTDETEKKCLDAGMDLRMTKPIEAKELVHAIAVQTAKTNEQTNQSPAADPLGVVSQLNGVSSDAQQPAVDPAQLDYLYSIGDEEFVRSVVESYLEDADDIMAAFRKAVDDENVDDFRFHAHAFKSGATNIGASQLVDICGRLEVINEPDFQNRRLEYLAKVEQQVSDIRNCLAPTVAASDTKTASDSDADLSKSALF